VTLALGAIAVVATILAVIRALRVDDPFLEIRLFRSVPFSAAAVVSLLTGYAFATAIIGGAVFVDRVIYGGPDQQRLALGALAASTAAGALLSGFLVRVSSYRLVTLIGIALSVGGLVAMATWTADTTIETVALGLAVFGAGFGMTVTPRSTAAVEAAGKRAFGAASSVVTVARMIGMAVGLAILTAYGSTTIDRLSAEVYATPDAYLAYIPEHLRDRPLRDPLVVEALESWASREAAAIMVGLFLAAAVVTVAATPAALALGGARGTPAEARAEADTRMLAADGSPEPDLIL
jgi:MFS family permease